MVVDVVVVVVVVVAMVVTWKQKIPETKHESTAVILEIHRQHPIYIFPSSKETLSWSSPFADDDLVPHLYGFSLRFCLSFCSFHHVDLPPMTRRTQQSSLLVAAASSDVVADILPIHVVVLLASFVEDVPGHLELGTLLAVGLPGRRTISGSPDREVVDDAVAALLTHSLSSGTVVVVNGFGLGQVFGCFFVRADKQE